MIATRMATSAAAAPAFGARPAPRHEEPEEDQDRQGCEERGPERRPENGVVEGGELLLVGPRAWRGLEESGGVRPGRFVSKI